MQEWCEQHEQAFEQRHATSTIAVALGTRALNAVPAPVGEFAGASGKFRFDAGAGMRPARPWINVLANPAFGAQVSEAGGGYTWAVNSRLNQLIAWSNDPVADPPAEWFLLQDRKTLQVWSVAPSACGDERAVYRVSHGQGYSVIRHRRGDVDVTASWCVDARTSVKQARVRIVNRSHKTLQLRLIGIAEWMMGARRADRATVHTALYRQRLPEQKLTALLCTQSESSAGFGSGTAFLGLAGADDESEDWTCDRRECFDARGRLVLPDYFGQRSGAGLDPCAALSTKLTLAAGEAAERVFLLGYGTNPAAAQQLAALAAATPALQRLEQARELWDRLLGAATVTTPDPLFDALVNRWLLYQTVSCRLWAKAGFYQAGGATGFRDHLQDAMALAWAGPAMLRQQILVGASRQFAAGDVQHWRHRCMNTLRAIDRSLRVGAHGLPLMGSGDWNDGMNRVGHEGRGESVWLGWFLCGLVADFAPLARQRGDEHRAQTWEAAARGWTLALNGPAWDGQLFKRAFFDDGQALGSHANPEARIDLIAQAWAVLSGAAPVALQRMALAAMEEHLVDHEAGLLKLLDPPLAHASPSAGYIQAYPPGVRENGGQYSHGGVWALMAQARFHTELAQSHSGPRGSSDGADAAYRYFTYLSPAHRARHPTLGAAYGIEPYVMAGDVYTQPPYVGRGGWSWYTGSAALMHRAAIESIFGLRLGAQNLSFMPCLPSHWQRAELTLRRDGRKMRFILIRSSAPAALAATAQWNAQLLRPGELFNWAATPLDNCFVMPLEPETVSGPDARFATAAAQL